MEPGAFLCTACGYIHDASAWYFREWDNRSPTYVCAEKYEQLLDQSQWHVFKSADTPLYQP